MRAQGVQVMSRVTGHPFKCRYGRAPDGLGTRCAQTVQAVFPALRPSGTKMSGQWCPGTWPERPV